MAKRGVVNEAGPVSVPQQESRPVYTFPVPEELKVPDHIEKTVGLVKLKPREELRASKRADGDAYTLAYELAKAAMYKVDGKLVNVGEGEDEMLWGKMDPMLRQLILTAYNKLHSPDDGVAKSFLDGMKVTVG